MKPKMLGPAHWGLFDRFYPYVRLTGVGTKLYATFGGTGRLRRTPLSTNCSMPSVVMLSSSAGSHESSRGSRSG